MTWAAKHRLEMTSRNGQRACANRVSVQAVARKGIQEER